ncbi:MAG: NUDIX hydrolase [Thermoanaerobaculia bacterium]|nr:NUDIX hydrolase [Thermoanaerobaculia bacterium]
MKLRLALVAALVLITIPVAADDLPTGYWPPSKVAEILAKTQTVRLKPDLSKLTEGERECVKHLLAAGKIIQRIYEDSRHPDAIKSLEALDELHEASGNGKRTGDLLALYRLNQGPIAATLDNKREPFLPVRPQAPTRNVYPEGATREELDAFLAKHPEARASILGDRTVVRRSTKSSLKADLTTLARVPLIDGMHPGLSARLLALLDAGDETGFYAVPQSLAWAAESVAIYKLLHLAADAIENDDAEFARYLRNRGRDFLTDDYESGDASWVTGRFQRLNAQIGSYETYDDAMYGVKAFHSLSILVRNDETSARVAKVIGNLQAIEDSLPYENHRRVRENIPVGVYDVVADFGQSRGANTATILPNDPLMTSRYGRTILLRGNIMKNGALFPNTKAAWDAAVAPELASHLVPEGNFHRTLWHEIGHYLGVDRDEKGRALDVALEGSADSIEEMKSDLVSLYSIPALLKSGYYDDEMARSVYASGIQRVIQNVKPRRDQPYQTMQLVQFNWFVDKGLLSADPKTKRLSIRYDRYHEAVASLLKEVLAIQRAGDVKAADAFLVKWTTWTPELHEEVAKRIRGAQKYRFTLMTYEALGD